ncbi:MAG: MarR family winged helix-turn-helix transcriptional regulator [Granulosicoccus sp.]
MKQPSDRQVERIRQRRARERLNIFSRLPATYAVSRLQGQRLLQHAGPLSILEWRVLWDLHECGSMTIRDLAEIHRTDHSQLSRALPAMRDKGYVTMIRDSDDGRQVMVELADAGKRAYSTSAPVMKRRRDALQQEFTAEELATFAALLDRMDDFLRRPINQILNSEVTE